MDRSVIVAPLRKPPAWLLLPFTASSRPGPRHGSSGLSAGRAPATRNAYLGSWYTRPVAVSALSPLSPVLGGEGPGVRGSGPLARDDRCRLGILTPSPPTPLPRVQGRGE